jgi:hypothetical protein
MTAFLLSLAAEIGVAGLIAWVDRKGHLTRPLNEPITQLRIDYPALEFIDTLVTADGRNTLALARSGEVAVALAFGDSWVTRRFASLPTAAVHAHGPALEILSGDFTLPRMRLTLPSNELAALWSNRLTAPAARSATQSSMAARPEHAA